MAMLELLTAEVKADSDFSYHDDYGCRTFGRVRYFSGSMLMLQLLGLPLCQDVFCKALALLRKGE